MTRWQKSLIILINGLILGAGWMLLPAGSQTTSRPPFLAYGRTSGGVNVPILVNSSGVVKTVGEPGAAPGGAATDVQYNDDGVLGGSADLTWAGGILNLGAAMSANAVQVQGNGVNDSQGTRSLLSLVADDTMPYSLSLYELADMAYAKFYVDSMGLNVVATAGFNFSGGPIFSGNGLSVPVGGGALVDFTGDTPTIQQTDTITSLLDLHSTNTSPWSLRFWTDDYTTDPNNGAISIYQGGDGYANFEVGASSSVFVGSGPGLFFQSGDGQDDGMMTPYNGGDFWIAFGSGVNGGRNGTIRVNGSLGVTDDVVIGGTTLHFVSGIYTGAN